MEAADATTPAPPPPSSSPSGIRAIPSRDDSDGESFMLSDGVPPGEVANEGFSDTNSSVGSSSSDSDKEEEVVGPFVDVGEGLGKLREEEGGEGFEEVVQEFLTPRAGIPIAKISVDDDDDEEEEEIEDGFRTAVAGPGNPRGAVFDDPVTEAGLVLELEEGEENGKFTREGDAVVDSISVDPVEAVRSGVAVVGEAEESKGSEAVLKAAVENGVEFTGEGDAVVDSISVDPVEAVRSGVAVIGEAAGSKVEGSADEELGFDESNDVEVVRDEPTNGGDSVVDSVGVEDTELSKTKETESSVGEENSAPATAVVDGTDDTEAVVSGEANAAEESEARLDEVTVLEKPDSAKAGVAGEAEVVEDSEARLDEVSVPEKPDSAEAGVGEVGREENTSQEDSVVDKINVDVVEAVQSGAVVVGERVEEAKAGVGEVGGEENTLQEDSVVDKINVNVVEAVQSGAVVVGEHVEEAKENGPVVDESIGTELESSKQDANTVELKENGSAVDNSIGTVLESSKHDANTMEVKENGSAVDDSIGTELKSSKHDSDTMDAVVSEEMSSDSIDNLPTKNNAAVQVASPEALKSEVLEQTDGDVDVVPGQDEEKAEEEQTTGDAIKANDRGLDTLHLSESTEEGEAVRSGLTLEAEDDDKPETDDEELNGSTDGETDGMVFGSSAAARQFMQELQRASGADSQVSAGGSHEHPQEVDGQIVTDSEEEANSDNEQEGPELFDAAALAALLKAATNASGDPDGLVMQAQDGTRVFSLERPAGLGSSLRSVRPSARPISSSMFAPAGATAVSEESLSEEERKKLENLQQLRVKFLRLVYRLGHSAEDSVATQVLYRLALVAGRPSVPSFSLDVAKQAALDLEEESTGDLNLSLNILLLGKSGVGKSATINSIFGEEKVSISAFEPGTAAVNEITGVVSGVNVRVFDTPGLKSSALEQGFNRKVLGSVKKITKNSPPDIVLYVDRLDSQTKDLNDLPMLRTITSCLGATIWRNAIVTLTHAACAPPDGPSGSPLSYEVFVAQRSHTVQQYIGQAVGDFRLMSPGMMNPVSLVENHLACRRNREGQKVLPNGQTWKPQLMLLCFSMKILSEATSVTKASDSNDQRKLFGFRVRSPPLPYLLSSLLQPRAHPKLSADQGGDNGDSDIDPDDFDDLDGEEEEDEYDQLPPFKPLRKAQIARLSKDQRKAYLEEYDYRVKLLQKKQWKEELKRMRDSKNNKGATNVDEYGQRPEEYDQESETPAAVPVPLPDMALPPTFDGDNPAYRYRFLEPTSQFLARPVLDTHGWDHDCGYDGVNVEQNLGIAGRFPAALTVQVTSDKKDFNLHLDSSVSAKHGENGSSLLGFDVQNIGKQRGYIVRGETKFKNLKKNKTAAGVSVTFLGENIATGVKVEDQISLGKRLVLVGSGGTVRSQKDAAYGANLEVRLKDAEYPIGQDQSSFVLSLMKWRGDLAIGGNLQSQVSVGRNSKMVVRVALNNKRSGQITVRTSSSDHLQLALVGLLPIAVSIFRIFRPGVSDNYPIY